MPAIRDLPLPLPPEPVAPRGRLGLVALGTDFNSEDELNRLAPEGVGIFTNRLANHNPISVANLGAMAADLTRAAAGILPGYALDALIFACTSGAAVIGEAEIARRLKAARPGIACTEPLTAARVACATLEARRIAVLTPYTREVNRHLADVLEARGLEVLGIAGFGLESDESMTGLAAEAVFEAAGEVYDPRADLLFISCTALRIAGRIGELEARLARPVIASNQALLWHALNLIGGFRPEPRLGRLFTLPAALAPDAA